MNKPMEFNCPNPFRPKGVITFADVLQAAAASLDGTARRDTVSAFRRIAGKLDIDLAEIPATPAAVRDLMGDLTPGDVGLSPKTLANYRSLVARAVEQFGMRRRVVTKAVPLTLEWQPLLDRADPIHYRYGLNRFACYCSAVGLSPEEVSSDTLVHFHDALVEESYVKKPRKIIKHTIALWNHCMRGIEGWPQITLASPFVTEPDTFPLEAFPQSFQDDVERWKARVTVIDVLDLEAPVKPLRPATVKFYIMVMRRFGSALVRRGVRPIEEVTDLGVFFAGDNFREGLRHFLPDTGEPRNKYAHSLANALLNVANHYVKLPEPELVRLRALAARLDPGGPRGMGRRNRDRLEQFDEPEAVRKLLTYPREERERALKCKSAIRKAKAMELALAVSLLIATCVRIENLRSIRLDQSIRRTSRGVILEFFPDAVKNEVDLTFELPAETVALLDSFLAEDRPTLPGHEGPYLFPGLDGGPRSGNAMRDAVTSGLKRHCGITMHPHLFRHAIAKIVIERDPGLYVAVSRHLGHKSMDTTLGSYLGTETRAGSRTLNKLLDAARDNPELED